MADIFKVPEDGNLRKATLDVTLSYGDINCIFTPAIFMPSVVLRDDKELFIIIFGDYRSKRDINSLFYATNDANEIVNNTIKSVWGPYVCFIADKSRGDTYVIPDPTGVLNIYYIAIGACIFLSQRIEHIIERTNLRPTINVKHFVQFTAFHTTTQSETAFEKIMSVPRGHMLFISREGDITTRRIWPLPYATSVRNENERIEELCSVLEMATQASIERVHRDIPVVSISGGVDSSSISSIVRRLVGHDRQISGYNFFYSDSAESDEREYAISIARELNIDLLCIDVSDKLPFSEIVLPGYPSSISHNFSLLKLNMYLDEIYGWSKNNSNGIFEGQGGDCLFWQTPSVACVRDAIATGGISLGVKALATQASLMRSSRTYIALKVIREMFSGTSTRYKLMRGWKHASITDMYCDINYVIENNPFDDDIYSSVHHEQFGRSEMIAMLLAQLDLNGDYVDGNCPMSINPFLSQPVIDYLLDVPGYECYDSTYDRILLRKAASRYTRSDVIWRKGKGTLDPQFIHGIKENGAILKDLVYSGIMIRNHIIKIGEAEMLFRRVDAGLTDASATLVSLLCAEMFAHRWGL
ncbi:hypothetical protein FM996_11785 [Methylosinus sporium]|uniref:asparagine synthase (glutamine-hydrolyzing) n=1 Tax=Methylosinus sporium TaxID=428 RepID=A0A549ST09_METSR|nr:asparagine synthase-related protein [Methylosinus sporium]TRL32750.1 hypothetical protein FM996_11785 [Methylosinus sporium]